MNEHQKWTVGPLFGLAFGWLAGIAFVWWAAPLVFVAFMLGWERLKRAPIDGPAKREGQ